MYRRISALLICLIMVFSCSWAANAEYNQEILFNDIPWGSTYQDVTAALSKQYNVSFTAPEYSYYKPDKSVYAPADLPFSLATSFDVYSKHAVKIADLPAYIVLHFVFPNDGKNVLNEDINGAIFTKAEYRFWTNKEAIDAATYPEVQKTSYDVAYQNALDLVIKLETIYGKSEAIKSSGITLGGSDMYKAVGTHNSSVCLRAGGIIVGSGRSSIYMTYLPGDQGLGVNLGQSENLLLQQIQQEKKQRSEAQQREKEAHEQEVANGNKNGL